MSAGASEMIKVPLGPPDAGALRLVLFAAPPDAGRGEPFWLLRRDPEVSVYLGGLIDAAGGVHEMLEIRVQRIGGYAAAFPVLARDWGHAEFDRKWQEMREDIAAADGPATLRLGIEDATAGPLILDASLAEHPEAGAWQLCRDDAALTAAGLPAYRRSLHRYLRNDEAGDWVALTADAPLAGIARHFKQAFPDAICFNPEGGRMFCRAASMIDWRDYAGCLRGRRWQAEVPGEWLAVLPPIYRSLASDQAEGGHWKHFLLPQLGPEAGRAESFYLKLALLHNAVETIAAATARRGAPFLNLTDAHFGVCLSDAGDALPALWTARVGLARGGGAVKVGEGCYLPESGIPSGPYRIAGPLVSLAATGSLRVRKVGEVVDGLASVEGTLQTDADVSGALGFRIEVRFESAGGALALTGGISPGAAPGTLLFAGKIPAAARSALVEGADYPKVGMVLHPKLGSACDLYSLGVLGLQLFLETSGRSLAMVCDDALQLRDRIPADTTALALPSVVRDLAAGLEVFSAESANAPDALWWEMLACLIRMLGGGGAAAYFREAAEGLDDAPQAIYRQSLADLGGLLCRARVRVLGQNERNREIREVIQEVMSEVRRSPG
jgi:hypothetical protein